MPQLYDNVRTQEAIEVEHESRCMPCTAVQTGPAAAKVRAATGGGGAYGVCIRRFLVTSVYETGAARADGGEARPRPGWRARPRRDGTAVGLEPAPAGP